MFSAPSGEMYVPAVVYDIHPFRNSKGFSILIFSVSSYSCMNYTERQKKLITSSEWHSLKSTASKWFIFRHRLGKFILNKNNKHI